MDGSNTEDPDAGRPFSSEPPNQDAAGIPDGSGTHLPDGKIEPPQVCALSLSLSLFFFTKDRRRR